MANNGNNNQNGQNTQNNNVNNGQNQTNNQNQNNNGQNNTQNKNGFGKLLDTVATAPAKFLRWTGNTLLKAAKTVEEHPIGTVATGVATYIVIKNKDSLIESGKNLLNGGNDGNVNQNVSE